MVNEWRQLGEESPIRYYKKKGEHNDDVLKKTKKDKKKSDFEANDFLLVFQTKLQSQIIAANPRTLCVDGSHGVTGYDYFLLTILVLDRYGQGFPCAWAISSRENGYVWFLVGRALRKESQDAKPEVLMSDDTNSAWNGLRKIWKSLKYKLLCEWHIQRNIKLHCTGSKSKVQVQCIFFHDFERICSLYVLG